MRRLVDRTLIFVYDSLESLDGFLDSIPSYEEKRWFRHGGWGCRMNMHKLWDRPNDK